jgi:hypothetical protein
MGGTIFTTNYKYEGLQMGLSLYPTFVDAYGARPIGVAPGGLSSRLPSYQPR